MGKVKLNRKGMRQLLASDEVRQDLRARAQRIASAAGDGFETDVDTGGKRARASVRTVTISAMIAEGRHAALTRAVDAGR